MLPPSHETCLRFVKVYMYLPSVYIYPNFDQSKTNFMGRREQLLLVLVYTVMFVHTKFFGPPFL
jgi:hypothetical protein